MLLDIIVAHYTEPWETGRKLFWMIDLQRGVDFGQFRVLVVNDGGHRLPEEELARLSYKVEQIDIGHGGISKARNTGIERARAPFVMFCDFDDTFTNIYALRDIISLLPCDFDMLWSQLLVEDYLDGKEMLYMTPERQRFVFVHGKVYRRDFLLEQNLRFDEGMTFQEDSQFNAVITARTDFRRIGGIKAQSPPYVWIRRQNSVTNSGRDDEARYWHFRRNLNVTDENRADPDRHRGMVTRTVYDTYYMIHGAHTGLQMKKRILMEFIPWIAKRKELFGDVEDGILRQIIDVSRTELLDPGERVPDDPETVRKWTDRITKEDSTWQATRQTST
jgi:glycosyltransferase involved in cell wall biosynthesis